MLVGYVGSKLAIRSLDVVCNRQEELNEEMLSVAVTWEWMKGKHSYLHIGPTIYGNCKSRKQWIRKQRLIRRQQKQRKRGN